jgi:hypothetical protein
MYSALGSFGTVSPRPHGSSTGLAQDLQLYVRLVVRHLNNRPVAEAYVAFKKAGLILTDGSVFGVVFVGLVIFALYFLPWIVAEMRKHRNATAIGVLNLFTGWTFIGWVIALVWAFTDNRRQEAR